MAIAYQCMPIIICDKFIPGLCSSYDLYEEMKKPENYRTICNIRYPRDISMAFFYAEDLRENG